MKKSLIRYKARIRMYKENKRARYGRSQGHTKLYGKKIVNRDHGAGQEAKRPENSH